MDKIGNTCIISVGVGGWYAQGVSRLEKSLIFHGYAGQVLTWKDEYPEGCPTHEENPYALKIFAFNEAFKRGYKCVMWVDASFWAIKNPHHIFDIINENGVFAFRNGYNCANTCTDNLLNYAGFSRDKAEHLPEIAGGMIGINIDNPDGKKVFKEWSKMCEMGLFKNSRAHNSDESQDPRYLHGRQDQSALSMAIHMNKIEFCYENYVSYYDGRSQDKYHENVSFLISGL